MSGDEEPFLSRWARRKSEAPDDEPAETQTAPPSEPVEETEGDPEVIARLPEIESLTESSDFSVFMAEGVPDVLRRRALRRLWRLNPVFANLDGLNDYDEDFTDAATVIEGLKTAYKVGKGMPDKEPEVEPETEAEVSAQVNEGEDEESGGDETVEEAAETPSEADPEALEEAHLEGPMTRELEEPDPVAASPAKGRDSGRSALRRRWGDSSA